MKPTFSIIIPAHNGEQCLPKCLDSVFGQHYRNFEIIVICDACTDRTADIAREYPIDQVYEVNFKRDGLTRNVGLDHAAADWVLFLDCDDWWMHEYVLDQLIEQIHQNPGMDCLYFSFIWKGVGYRSQSADHHYVAVWNKLWRRSFIGETRFTDIPYWSDASFDAVMSRKPGNRIYWDNPLYYYNFMNPGSINDLYARGEIR